MRGSWKLGRLFGIDLFIHWTFWILLLFWTLSGLGEAGIAGGATAAAFILALFTCVVAHEYGHALTARAFGIPTHDITVLPIGGLARLSKLPEKPVQELLIAVAGPAVNAVIFGFLFVCIAAAAISEELWQFSSPGSGLLVNLMIANLALVVFNLLPAFPMDGGRVLRSLLAMRLPYLRATEIAARVGRWMALVFLAAAFAYGQLGLALIALFVFAAGTAELFEARRRAAGTSNWVQWVWMPGSVNPNSSFQYTTNPHGTANSDDEDIIDVTDFREVKSHPGLPR